MRIEEVKVRVGVSERCDYDGPDNTICYVQNQKQGLIEKIMGSHEVCHFLNYEDGVTDFKKVKKTDSWPVWFIGMIICSIISLFMISLMTIINISLLVIFSYIVVSCVWIYKAWVSVPEKLRIYAEDEQLTQDRAVKELLAISPKYGLDLDKEEVERVAQEFVNQYVYKFNRQMRFSAVLIGIITITLNIGIIIKLFI